MDEEANDTEERQLVTQTPLKRNDFPREYFDSEMTLRFEALCNDSHFTEKILSSSSFFPYPKNEIRSIFVRKRYLEIYEFIERDWNTTDRFLVYGSNGVGKSYFFLFLLYKLVNGYGNHPFKSILYQSSQSVYYHYDLQSRKVYSLVGPIAPSSIPAEKKVLHVVDSEKLDDFPFKYTLLITSVNSVSARKFVSDKLCKRLFMSMFTLEEVIFCNLK